MKLIIFVTALVVALAFTFPGMTQSRKPELSNSLYECRGASCRRAVVPEIQRLRRQNLTEDEFNSRLGVLAAQLFDIAKEAENKKTSTRVARAMIQLARYSSDEQQRASLKWISDALRTGDSSLFDLEDPFAVSPS